MQAPGGDKVAAGVPKKRERHYSYDENVDESAKLIESEAVEIEAEIPAEENEPVEGAKPEEKPAAPVFEDDEPSA
jgi:hypothetical protein